MGLLTAMTREGRWQMLLPPLLLVAALMVDRLGGGKLLLEGRAHPIVLLAVGMIGFGAMIPWSWRRVVRRTPELAGSPRGRLFHSLIVLLHWMVFVLPALALVIGGSWGLGLVEAVAWTSVF
ncbi:hypothetical protein Pan216_00230 [Planctomycetes bacterium Pan216]|uniref:Uncharacterized protein n=1 Tax=Kolteria novifilia TaxID=2527975 RepID=A0A518AWV4_9BACT|nr:hypothetical protein Pan216_00230 [Planctomycetes bacterium Pan216]